MAEVVTAQRSRADMLHSRVELLTPGNIPAELSQSARGRFPLIEQSLFAHKSNSAIPADWKVETLLSAISVGHTTLQRLEANLEPQPPDEVRLILDGDNYTISDRTGLLGYGVVDYEVRYPDKTVWRGHTKMPGFYREDNVLSGIPWSETKDGSDLPDIPEDHREVFGEHNRIIDDKKNLTPMGLRLVSFLAGTIASYNRFYFGTEVED